EQEDGPAAARGRRRGTRESTCQDCAGAQRAGTAPRERGTREDSPARARNARGRSCQGTGKQRGTHEGSPAEGRRRRRRGTGEGGPYHGAGCTRAAYEGYGGAASWAARVRVR